MRVITVIRKWDSGGVRRFCVHEVPTHFEGRCAKAGRSQVPARNFPAISCEPEPPIRNCLEVFARTLSPQDAGVEAPRSWLPPPFAFARFGVRSDRGLRALCRPRIASLERQHPTSRSMLVCQSRRLPYFRLSDQASAICQVSEDELRLVPCVSNLAR